MHSSFLSLPFSLFVICRLEQSSHLLVRHQLSGAVETQKNPQNLVSSLFSGTDDCKTSRFPALLPHSECLQKTAPLAQKIPTTILFVEICFVALWSPIHIHICGF